MSETAELKAIFDNVESTVIAAGHRKQRAKPMPAALRDGAATAAVTHTDADYFRKMVHVIFYSGFKAATVTHKIPAIDGHFSSYSVVAGYADEDVSRILADTEILRNEGKIRACVCGFTVKYECMSVFYDL
jgi:3-methyladenine DNA glycosylase Tag